MNIFKKISLSALVATLILTISACGNSGADEQAQVSSASKISSAFILNGQIDVTINKTEMLATLSDFFKVAALSEEDHQQIKAATLRETTQRGRLPNYMAGETLASPAVLASAVTNAQSGSNVVAQANFLNSTPVYRFYNLWTNVHFYTASESERANVIATAPHFRNEGTAFFASSVQAPNTLPVYRFYNYSTGAHFYTISQSERDNVVANLAQYYRFEGIAYHANPNPDPDLIPVYRFYNFNIGAHFYTASSTERAYVIQTFPFMRDEGIAYYVSASRSYTLAGAVSGLGSGKTVVLTLNGAADLSVSSNSSFMFGAALTSAQTYSIAVKTQPAGQTCSIANGSGTVGSAAISNITVTCTDSIIPVTIGGVLTGLGVSKSVVLSLNGGSDLTFSSNTGFTFAGTILSGQAYAVTVKTQPIGQLCSVTNGSGTVPATNVTNVSVSCLNYVTVGGSVSGLNTGNSVTLQLNGVQSRTFTSNTTAYSFSSPIVSGQTYSVLIQTQPVGQLCSIANGTGTAITNVTNVNVTCVSLVKVGGTVTGLGTGKTITLTLNGSTDLAVNTSSFQFPTVLTTGQLYSVVIKTQAGGQTCNIANNSGTAAAADVTNVAVSCVNNVTIGGTLSGLNASATTVTITLNGGSDLMLTTNGSFIFATTLPDMQIFAVIVKTQPVGQTCSVTNGNAIASGNMTDVVVNCVNNAPAGLMISEVANCPSGGCWFEVFNPTNTSVNLSAYSLKTQSSITGAAYTFALPSLTIAPNAYAIVQGNPSNSIKNLNLQTALVNDAGVVPYWLSSGFIELISKSTGATLDFVKFGTNTQEPTTSTHWVGVQAPALNSGYGYSIVRAVGTISSQDTNSAIDWTSVSFTTPGGQNDVPPNAVDSDNDGIPDSSELPGSTYAGMDLYSMGARQGVRDIFIEVDHMNSTDPGIIPRVEALQKVVDAFTAKGVALHFDAGTQFSATFSPANFNLGQGNSTVAYEKCVGFDSSICVSNTSQFRSVYDWKLANFELRRKNIFHYMLFGNSQADTGLQGSSGRAEISGNDSIITLGNWGLLATSGFNLNVLINYQAGTVMHEFGHNLGLLHGGNEDANYKPNYYSVMNYLYQLNGLAQSSSSIGPYQRWAFQNGVGGVGRCSMLNSTCDSPSQFVINFSDGSGASLNESSLSESANIGRGADVGVYADWNNSGTKDAVNYARDINGTSSNSILNDYNDWANLTLPFHRYYNGMDGISTTSTRLTTQLDPMNNDRQPTSDCTPNPLWLRLAMQVR